MDGESRAPPPREPRSGAGCWRDRGEGGGGAGGAGGAGARRPRRGPAGLEVRAPHRCVCAASRFPERRRSLTFVFFPPPSQSAIKGKLQELGAYVGKLCCFCEPNAIESVQLF